uniref:Peptidase S1 domain-containing protein n=1 Tax=Glossina brevipalpis TaxID=37001 RepID=A0A1A9WX92_9MUSC
MMRLLRPSFTVHHSLSQENHEYAKYVVSLRKQKEKIFGESHFCAGTIIKDDMILTAANCAMQTRHGRPLRYYKVIAGTPQLTAPSDSNDEKLWLFFEVYEISADFENIIDLAVIKITPAFTLGNDAVAIIQLDTNTYEGGEECYVGGWGDQKVGYDDYISFEKVTLLSDSTCAGKYPAHLDIVCASNSLDTECKMDWGGPLICSDKLTAVLVGSEYCGEKKPCIYTSVAKSLHWINKTVNELIMKTVSLLIKFVMFIIYLFLILFVNVANGGHFRDHVVQIQCREQSKLKCGGVIIGEHLILTAASCLGTTPNCLVVRLSKRKKIPVAYAARHSGFRWTKEYSTDNIALIKTKEELMFDKKAIIKIAARTPPPGTVCTMTDGQSKDCRKDSDWQDGYLCVVAKDRGQRMKRNAILPQKCQVKDGAAFICNDKLVAIASHSNCRLGQTFYPQVNHYREWIEFMDSQFQDDDTVEDISDLWWTRAGSDSKITTTTGKYGLLQIPLSYDEDDESYWNSDYDHDYAYYLPKSKTHLDANEDFKQSYDFGDDNSHNISEKGVAYKFRSQLYPVFIFSIVFTII